MSLGRTRARRGLLLALAFTWLFVGPSLPQRPTERGVSATGATATEASPEAKPKDASDGVERALDAPFEQILKDLLDAHENEVDALLARGRRLAGADPFRHAQLDHVLSLRHERRGITNAARELSRRSLAAFRLAARDARPEAIEWLASAEHNAGVLQLDQGLLEAAREHLEAALHLRERTESPDSLGATLMQLGWLAYLGGDLAAATALLERSYALRTKAAGRAASLDRLGTVHAAAGRLDDAAAAYRAALDVYRHDEASAKSGLGHVLSNLGWLRLHDPSSLDRAQAAQARNELRAALPMLEALDDDDAVSHALTGLARAERVLGRPLDALRHLDAAVARLDQLRGQIDLRTQRRSFLAAAARQRPFVDRVDLLASLAHEDPAYLERALSASEQGRSRMLLDTLMQASRAASSSADPESTARELAEIGQEISTLRLRTRRSPLDDPSSTAEHLAVLTARYERLRDEVSMPRSVLDPQELVRLDTVRSLIDDDTSVLSFVVGESESHLFVVDRDRISLHALPDRATLRRGADAAHRSLSARTPRARAQRSSAIDELSRQLFSSLEPSSSPAERQPARQTLRRRLVVVKDDALHRLPFAALPRAGAPLIERHEIVAVPSLGALTVLRRRAEAADPSTERVVVIAPDAAAPAGSPPRVRRADDLPRLDVEREVAALRELVPERHLQIFAGAAANRRALLGGLAGVRILHLSAHAVLHDRFPELSALVLAGPFGDETLHLQEIFGLDLPAEMVVLGACETALGDMLPGEGMVGMTHAFLGAGARRVVVSHWPVDDEATAELMERFYRQLFGVGLDAPAALRQAQLDLRAAGHGRWRAPYYWAPFEVQGDWR
ncbi:MAG: CHAT domain-containing tetratricopeptide repeat protein [Acidobacteriota bacterium]